ncbi:MAG: hypothetical protein ACR2H0_00455 [Candidatus Limnocylindrales bacterium]
MEIERISTAYEIRVRALLGGDLPEELMLRDRLDPQRWILEWNLARWLSQAYGLDARLTDEISVSNLLGLASIRLRDDVEDGELAAATGSAAAFDISDRLYEDALAIYRRSFDPASDFWAYLSEQMSVWRAATVDGGSPNRLAGRGAPLKISAFGVCLLTDRADQFLLIDRSLDRALTAMVRYDHLVDWRDDLAAGRWNAFVEASVRTVKSARATRPSDAEVQLAMLTTDAIEAYFDRIVGDLERASTLARAAGVPLLATHLAGTAADLGDQGATLAARYRAISERARQLLFGIQPPLAA